MRRHPTLAIAVSLLVGLLSLAAAPAVPARAAAATALRVAAASDCMLPVDGHMGELDWARFQRPAGVVRAVMLFVDFPDAPAQGSAGGLFEELGVARAASWLRASSYGKVSLQISPVRHWLRMPAPLASYEKEHGALPDAVAARYAADAIAAADADVDFSAARIVLIVPNVEATGLPRSSEHDLEPAQWVVADGRALRSVVTFGTAVYERGFRTIAHETSHAFGLYDYYNGFGSPTDRYAGAWSLMADSVRGADHFAWDKWRMGWISDAQVRCVNAASRGDVVLSPLETPGGVKAVLLRTGLRTAVVAEFRTRRGLDAGICSTGVLVYKVNSALKGGAGLLRVSDARPRSVRSSGKCSGELDDAAFRAGRRWTDSTSGLAIDVLAIGSGARIRVTRTKAYTPPAAHARTMTTTLVSNPDGTVTLSAVLAAAGFSACAGGRFVELQRSRAGRPPAAAPAPRSRGRPSDHKDLYRRGLSGAPLPNSTARSLHVIAGPNSRSECPRGGLERPRKGQNRAGDAFL